MKAVSDKCFLIANCVTLVQQHKAPPLLGLLDPGHLALIQHPVFLQRGSGISNKGPFLRMPANNAMFCFTAERRLFTMEGKHFKY